MDVLFADVNIGAVLVCTLVALVSGFIWYNPKTFFLIWWKAIGKTEKDMNRDKGMGATWTLTIISSFIQPLILALLLGLIFPDGASAWQGLEIGALLWLGFIAPTYMVNKLFANHGLLVWSIETGNHLLNMMLFGLILGAWH